MKKFNKLQFEEIRKPTHRSSNYAFWRCGYRGHGDVQAERLVIKLSDRGFAEVKTRYTDGKVSVHVYV